MVWHTGWNLDDAKHLLTDGSWRNCAITSALNADSLVCGIKQPLRFLVPDRVQNVFWMSVNGKALLMDKGHGFGLLLWLVGFLTPARWRGEELWAVFLWAVCLGSQGDAEFPGGCLPPHAQASAPMGGRGLLGASGNSARESARGFLLTSQSGGLGGHVHQQECFDYSSVNGHLGYFHLGCHEHRVQVSVWTPAFSFFGHTPKLDHMAILCLAFGGATEVFSSNKSEKTWWSWSLGSQLAIWACVDTPGRYSRTTGILGGFWHSHQVGRNLRYFL